MHLHLIDTTYSLAIQVSDQSIIDQRTRFLEEHRAHKPHSYHAGMCAAGGSGSGFNTSMQQHSSSSPLPACMRSARGSGLPPAVTVTTALMRLRSLHGLHMIQ